MNQAQNFELFNNCSKSGAIEVLKEKTLLPVEDRRHIIAIPVCHKNEGHRQSPTIENKVLKGTSTNVSDEPIIKKLGGKQSKRTGSYWGNGNKVEAK